MKNEIRRFPAKCHAYHCRLGVANGVADRLLGKTQQLMLDPWILGGNLSSGMLSDRKSQRNRPATFECSTKRFNVVVNPDSSIALERRLRMDLRASAKPNFAISFAR